MATRNHRAAAPQPENRGELSRILGLSLRLAPVLDLLFACLFGSSTKNGFSFHTMCCQGRLISIHVSRFDFNVSRLLG